MALSSIDGVLIEEANRLDGYLYEKSLGKTPWIDLIEVGEWPEEIGNVISTLIYERSLPSSALTWNKVGASDVTPGGGAQNTSILPPTQTIASAKTLREYNLEHTALHSEKLNVNDLRSAVQREDQLNAVYKMLSQNTNWLWQESNRSEYMRLASNKVVLSTINSATVGIDSAFSGVTLDDNGYPITVPDNTYGTDGGTDPDVIVGAQLSNAALAKYRQRLIREGAEPWDRMDNAPLFAIVCDSEVSDSLKTESGIREDLRFAGRGNELLAPFGVERPYKNFFHIIDDFAPRYTQDEETGEWTKVSPYTTSGATFGTKLVNNTDYEAAPWTDSVIFVKGVMQTLFPKPSVPGAAGVQFAPVQYRGQWSWNNVKNMDADSSAYNPDQTIGFFRGVFARASKPINVEYGYVLRHKRPGF